MSTFPAFLRKSKADLIGAINYYAVASSTEYPSHKKQIASLVGDLNSAIVNLKAFSANPSKSVPQVLCNKLDGAIEMFVSMYHFDESYVTTPGVTVNELILDDAIKLTSHAKSEMDRFNKVPVTGEEVCGTFASAGAAHNGQLPAYVEKAGIKTNAELEDHLAEMLVPKSERSGNILIFLKFRLEKLNRQDLEAFQEFELYGGDDEISVIPRNLWIMFTKADDFFRATLKHGTNLEGVFDPAP